MYIKTTYIGTLNNIYGIWCGFKPEDASIKEERTVLYAESGNLLINKYTGEITSCTWLQNPEDEENWVEVEPDAEDLEDSEEVPVDNIFLE